MSTPMSETAFKRMLAPFVKQGIPFLAYWHPAGMGLIRLDEVLVPSTPKGKVNDGYYPKHPHRVGKRGRQTWEKNLARLKKQTWGRVVTVAFDGKEITTEGGFDDELFIDR